MSSRGGAGKARLYVHSYPCESLISTPAGSGLACVSARMPLWKTSLIRLVALETGRLFLTVVDDAGDFAAEVLAVDDHVHEAVLEHELGGLEAVR